jgi:hypothetical protein
MGEKMTRNKVLSILVAAIALAAVFAESTGIFSTGGPGHMISSIHGNLCFIFGCKK